MDSSLGETTDSLDNGPHDASPPPTRTRRRSTREQLTRRLLASTAGLGVLATIVALAALPASPKASQVALPSAPQAEAAFVTGLLANPTTAKAAAPLAATMAPSNAVKVSIKNYAFSPASLTISAGQTVTWTNEDSAPHTVTVSSGPQTFSSPQLRTGDTYSFTFTKAGTYQYYCAVHPTMMASVTVTGGATTAPSSTPTTGTTAPSSAPPTMPMPMPSTGSGTSACAVSSALQTLLTHLNTAHLQESPGQQVNDILNVDTYIGNHLALVQRMFSPLTDGGLTSALSSLLSTFLVHVDTAHLAESPGQQVSDILDVNSYIGNHLALVERMTAPTTALVC
jgi:plastocyanin